MAEITLYTHEQPGAGLTSINVGRVPGAVALRIVKEGMVEEQPVGLRSSTIGRQDVHPVSGKADLLLQTTGKEVNLAKCKGAVALVVADGGLANATTIYWIDAGQCSEFRPNLPNAATARAEIEGRCCPEYELPPPIG